MPLHMDLPNGLAYLVTPTSGIEIFDNSSPKKNILVITLEPSM